MKPRLIIFTGKGGVGKTTLAMAYTLYLQQANHQVKYNSFNFTPDYKLIRSLDISVFDTDIEESAQIYIANKLNSTTIASWIMSTHFFKSLFQMIPSFGNMILIGHILKELENNPHLTIVLDSPASGHALAMFESSNNFKRIFKTGLIVDDIEKMKNKLEDPNFLKTYIVSLPNEMALTEAHEVDNELKKVYRNIEIIINNSFKKFCHKKSIHENELPDFLKAKITTEENLKENYKTFSHIPNNDFKTVIKELSEELAEEFRGQA